MENSNTLIDSGGSFDHLTRPATSPGSVAAKGRSANISWCLFVIYYFSLCDFLLKFVSPRYAIALRYFPEILIYILVATLLLKRLRVVSFPLFWPLVICAVSMVISGVLNSCPALDVVGDFRSYFRFSALCYVLWRTTITPRRIEQFVDGFLRLTIVEIVIGGIELIGGERARVFFAPAIDWQSGAPKVLLDTGANQGTWLSGTLSNYNHYGMFMVISCSLA